MQDPHSTDDWIFPEDEAVAPHQSQPILHYERRLSSNSAPLNTAAAAVNRRSSTDVPISTIISASTSTSTSIATSIATSTSTSIATSASGITSLPQTDGSEKIEPRRVSFKQRLDSSPLSSNPTTPQQTPITYPHNGHTSLQREGHTSLHQRTKSASAIVTTPTAIQNQTLSRTASLSATAMENVSDRLLKVMSSHQFAQRFHQVWAITQDSLSRQCGQTHVYHFPWEVVIAAYQKRFPRTKRLPHVLHSTLLEHKLDEKGRSMIALRQIVVDIEAPTWLQRLLKDKTVTFLHECHFDYASQRLTILGANITLQAYAHLFERCVYRVHPDQPQWTMFEQVAYMKLPNLPMMSTCEKLLFAAYEKNAKNGRIVDEELIKEVLVEDPSFDKLVSGASEISAVKGNTMPLMRMQSGQERASSIQDNWSPDNISSSNVENVTNHQERESATKFLLLSKDVQHLVSVISTYLGVEDQIIYQVGFVLIILLIGLLIADPYGVLLTILSVLFIAAPIAWSYQDYKAQENPQGDNSIQEQSDNLISSQVADVTVVSNIDTDKILLPNQQHQHQQRVGEPVANDPRPEMKAPTTPSESHRRHNRSTSLKSNSVVDTNFQNPEFSDILNTVGSVEPLYPLETLETMSVASSAQVGSEYSNFSTPCISVSRVEIPSIIDYTKDGRGYLMLVITSQGAVAQSRESRSDWLPLDAESFDHQGELPFSMNIVTISELIAFNHSCEDIWKTFRTRSTTELSRIKVTDLGFFANHPNATPFELEQYHQSFSSCDHALRSIEKHLRATLQDPVIARNRLMEVFLNIGSRAKFENEDLYNSQMLVTDHPGLVKHGRIIRVLYRTYWREEILVLKTDSLFSLDIRTKEILWTIPLKDVNSVSAITNNSIVAGWVFMEIKTVRASTYFCSTDCELIQEWTKSIMQQINHLHLQSAQATRDRISLRSSIEQYQRELNSRAQNDIILNRKRIAWDRQDVRPAEVVVTDLLETAVGLYEHARHENSGYMDDEAFAYRFYSFEKATAELQSVYLDIFSEEATAAFYMNLFHLILVHGLIALGAPSSVSVMSSFLKRTCYEVDGMIISLHEIEANILKTVMGRPRVMGVMLTRRISEIMHIQPKHRSILPSATLVYPLLSIALHRAHASSFPHVTIFRSDCLLDQIRELAKSYLRLSVCNTDTTKTISLPKIFEWIFEEYEMQPPTALALIIDLLDGDKKEDVKHLVEKEGAFSVKVKYQDYNWDYPPAFLIKKSHR